MSVALVVGVDHFDPLGPQKVHAILNQFKAEGFAPKYVCVEWKKEIAEEIIKQRNKFSLKIRDLFHNLSNEDVEAFEKAIAFEADSHIQVFPNTKIIWLDEKRAVDINDPVVVNYLEYRLNIYKNCDNNASVAEVSKMVLGLLSERTPNPLELERDKKFFEAVHTETDCNCDILCIVGAIHGNVDIDGSFAYLLKANGYEVSFVDTTKM